MRKIISVVLSFGLLFQQSGLLYAAGEINLANYLSQAKSAIVQPDVFQPPRLRYISYDIASNDFKILLDKGETLKGLSPLAPKGQGTVPEKDELFNYFLIGLALPNDTFWVNLRPDAPENIIDPILEKTDIGKIFLEADLQLKKDTASLTSPQNPEGKAYWDNLYNKAGELFGTENITIPTITRPWIVPNEVIVRETEDSAYIYKATLKVMLEEDYLRGMKDDPAATGASGRGAINYSFNDPRLKELNEYSTQLIRETIIPKLTKEINSSKRYAQLRQVYYSLVLSRWFKQKYSSSGSVRASERPSTTLGASQSPGASANSYLSLIDSGNLANLASPEPCDKQTYFQAYQKSFKNGEYNLKETVATPFGQSIRSYISGGIVTSPIIFGGTRKEGDNPEVTETLTGQHAAIANSPLTLEGFDYIIAQLRRSPDSGIENIKKIIKFGLTIKGDESKKLVPQPTRERIDTILKEAGFIKNVPVFERSNTWGIGDILLAIQSALEESNKSLQVRLNSLKYEIITHFTIVEEKGQDEIQKVFDGAIKVEDAESGYYVIARFIDDLNKQYGGNEFPHHEELIVEILKKTMQINTLLSLFEGYNQQQKSLEETIKDQASIVVGSDNINNIRFGGLRDREKVKIGVEIILRKILEVSQDEAISYELLKSAQKVFIIASQEDKTYHYRPIIGSYIMPVFAEFLKKRSSGKVKDIQVKIRTVLSNYIQRNVFDFLRTFIKQKRDNPYGKFIGAEVILDALSAELEQETQEIILGQTDYDMEALSRIIKKLRGLSEDAKLKTVEENVSLIKIVTAGSPLTPQETLKRANEEVYSADKYFQYYRRNYILSYGQRIDGADPFSKEDVIEKLTNEIDALQDVINKSKQNGSQISDVVSFEALRIKNFFKKLRKELKNSSNQPDETRNSKVKNSGSPLTLDKAQEILKRDADEIKRIKNYSALQDADKKVLSYYLSYPNQPDIMSAVYKADNIRLSNKNIEWLDNINVENSFEADILLSKRDVIVELGYDFYSAIPEISEMIKRIPNLLDHKDIGDFLCEVIKTLNNRSKDYYLEASQGRSVDDYYDKLDELMIRMYRRELARIIYSGVVRFSAQTFQAAENILINNFVSQAVTNLKNALKDAIEEDIKSSGKITITSEPASLLARLSDMENKLLDPPGAAGSPLTQAINDLYAKLVPYKNDAIVFGRPMKSEEIDASMGELLDQALSSSDFLLDANTNEFKKLKIIFQLVAKYDDSKYKGVSSYASHLISNIEPYQPNKNIEEFILNVFHGYVDLLISDSVQETLKFRESASIAGVSTTYYDLNALKEEFPDDNGLAVISNHYEKTKKDNSFVWFTYMSEAIKKFDFVAFEGILQGFFPGSKDIIRFDGLPPADVIEMTSENLLKRILLIPGDSRTNLSERSNNIKRLFALASSGRYKKHSLYNEIVNCMSEESSLTESELQYEVKKGIAGYIDKFILRFESPDYKSILNEIHLKYEYSKERSILKNVPGLNEGNITVKEYNLKILIDMASLAQKITPADRAANKMALEVFQFLKECTSSSSLTVAIVPEVKRGGIDLTDRMLKIKLERVGSFASSSLALPEIADLEALDLDKEYERIQAMASVSIRPSDTRILEFAAACYYRGEFDQRLAQVSSCIKAAHLADEISGRDSSEALRLATMLPDALYGG